MEIGGSYKDQAMRAIRQVEILKSIFARKGLSEKLGWGKLELEVEIQEKTIQAYLSCDWDDLEYDMLFVS